MDDKNYAFMIVWSMVDIFDFEFRIIHNVTLTDKSNESQSLFFITSLWLFELFILSFR